MIRRPWQTIDGAREAARVAVQRQLAVIELVTSLVLV